MKLKVMDRSIALEHVEKSDIYFCNLSASKLPNQKFDPKHDIGIAIEDADILDFFHSQGVAIKDVVDRDTGEITGHYVVFRAYPGVKYNEFAKKDEDRPMVVLLKDGESSGERVPIKAFDTIDAIAKKEMNIIFHIFENNGYRIPAIDQLWVVKDPSAGIKTNRYFIDKYGYVDEYTQDAGDNYDEDIPFA